ncbi:MAG: hypothetical protein FJ090_12815 [Deltaproteobacteria bacterium]|nr:hypothetical protein [Deltaproteobacteria bacterium]
MIALAGLGVSLALGAAPADEGVPEVSPAIEASLVAELERARELRLPGKSAPSLVLYDVLDGDVRSCFGEDGGLVVESLERFRNLRVEVRVAEAGMDSSSFRAFGEPDGVVSRRLPVADDAYALRREVWLATDAAYKHAVEQLSRKQAAVQELPEPLPPDWTAAAPVVVREGKHDGNALGMAECREVVTRLTAGAPTSIEQVQAVVRDWHGWRTVVTSEGTRAWIPTGNVVVRVEATARRADGTPVQDARWWVGKDRSSLPSLAEMEGEVAAMRARLAAVVTGPSPEPWLGPVLFEGPAATELFSQLLAAEIVGTPPELEDGDSFLASTRGAMARLGRRLLPDGWRVHDDPSTRTGRAGEYAYDHDVVAPRRVDLVVDGVLRDVLMSRVPSKFRAASTGHGRSLGESRRGAMPGYVHVTPGRRLSEAALRRKALQLARQVGLDRVLVIERIRPPAMADRLDITISGEGPPPGLTDPYEACLLDRQGHCEPVRNLRFVGVDRRSLRDIVAAGPGAGPIDTLDGPPGPERFGIGSTGGVPVSWDVPSVLVAEMELDPSTGGEPRIIAP